MLKYAWYSFVNSKFPSSEKAVMENSICISCHPLRHSRRSDWTRSQPLSQNDAHYQANKYFPPQPELDSQEYWPGNSLFHTGPVLNMSVLWKNVCDFFQSPFLIVFIPHLRKLIQEFDRQTCFEETIKSWSWKVGGLWVWWVALQPTSELGHIRVFLEMMPGSCSKDWLYPWPSSFIAFNAKTFPLLWCMATFRFSFKCCYYIDLFFMEHYHLKMTVNPYKSIFSDPKMVPLGWKTITFSQEV